MNEILSESSLAESFELYWRNPLFVNEVGFFLNSERRSYLMKAAINPLHIAEGFER